MLPPIRAELLALSATLLARYAQWVEAARTSDEAAASSDTLLYIHNDCRIIKQQLLTALLPLADGCSAAGAPAAAAALREQAAALQASSDAALASLAEQTQQACVEGLAAVKALASTFIMTKRPTPTAPSVFISTALRPLRALLMGRQACLLIQPAGFASTVMAAVCASYEGMAAELLESVASTEKFLLSRKRGGGADGGAAGGAAGDGEGSASDKLRAQLALDIDALGAQMEELSVPAASCEQWTHLQRLLR
eukprot:PLAT10783.2.p1 GENE.PLAT10783.2~~PLAT10783.2.p1  ORF type:complete len:253 (-),score=120.34 PLAT10783.2:21-779(-)